MKRSKQTTGMKIREISMTWIEFSCKTDDNETDGYHCLLISIKTMPDDVYTHESRSTNNLTDLHVLRNSAFDRRLLIKHKHIYQ